MKWVEYMPIAI